jgi:hypothetical protein
MGLTTKKQREPLAPLAAGALANGTGNPVVALLPRATTEEALGNNGGRIDGKAGYQLESLRLFPLVPKSKFGTSKRIIRNGLLLDARKLLLL